MENTDADFINVPSNSWGALRLVLEWYLKKCWSILLALPQTLAGAMVVLAGLPNFLKPIPFSIPVWFTIGLLLSYLFLRRR